MPNYFPLLSVCISVTDIGLLAPSQLPINRQEISVVKRTSTTLLVSWRNSNTFGLDFSPDMPFSLAPFVYDVRNRLSRDQTTEHVSQAQCPFFSRVKGVEENC